MKKYYGIIIALLVLIGIVLTPSRVSASIKQSDLGGKVFLVDASGDSDYKPDNGAENERLLIMFNKKGTRYIKNFVNTDGQGNITGFPHYKEENKSEYNKAISSKKGWYKIDMDMPVKDELNDYEIKGNKVRMAGNWGTISKNGPNDYTITWKKDSTEDMGNYVAEGKSGDDFNASKNEVHTQHLSLAKQQYKFKW